MAVYAVIPARGGSKGIPGKNLRTVAGRTLVERAVDAARGAASVDRVFVSTDSDEIAEAARGAGAEVIVRPTDLSDDLASSESALLHALDVLGAEGAPDPETIVMLQCTSPFTASEDVDGTVALLAAGGADSAFTASASHAFLWRSGPAGATAVNHDAAHRPRRQDRVPEFVETGAVYAMRTAGFRAARHRFFGKIALFEVPRERAVEIDDLADLVLSEALAAGSTTPAGAAALPEELAALVFDFDGVITDNRVTTFQDGTESVVADRSDGLGIEMLRATGLPMVVISKETNAVVAARCRKLGLECIQSVGNAKESVFRNWVAERGLALANVVFVGNDVNDVGCMQIAGCAVAVADAHRSALAVADLVLTRPGGRGAVRELADMIIDRTNRA